MLRPEKLISSATRIYGDEMDRLWGEFLSVPEERLKVAEDAEQIVISVSERQVHGLGLFERTGRDAPFIGRPVEPLTS